MSIKRQQNGSKLTCHRNCLPPCQVPGMLIVCTKLELSWTALTLWTKTYLPAGRIQHEVTYSRFFGPILLDCRIDSSLLLNLTLESEGYFMLR